MVGIIKIKSQTKRKSSRRTLQGVDLIQVTLIIQAIFWLCGKKASHIRASYTVGVLKTR